MTTVDTGFNYTPPTGEQSMATAYTRYYAGWADKYASDVVGTWSQNQQFAYTLAQPYGVVGVIITWNGPVGSIGMKAPAALAAGNTVVIKPAELTPYSPST